jgi:hypothetical protein
MNNLMEWNCWLLAENIRFENNYKIYKYEMIHPVVL